MRTETAARWDALELRRPLNGMTDDFGLYGRWSAHHSTFERKSEIFAAARSLFDEAGDRNVTIRSLVRESHVTAPTIYKLIGNRNTVLEIALVEALQMCTTSAVRFSNETQINVVSSFLEACLQSTLRQPSYSRYQIRMLCGIEKGGRISAIFKSHYKYLFHNFVSSGPLRFEIPDDEIDLLADIIYATMQLSYLDWTEGRLSLKKLRRDLHDKVIFLIRDFISDTDKDYIRSYLLD